MSVGLLLAKKKSGVGAERTENICKISSKVRPRTLGRAWRRRKFAVMMCRAHPERTGMPTPSSDKNKVPAWAAAVAKILAVPTGIFPRDRGIPVEAAF